MTPDQGIIPDEGTTYASTGVDYNLLDPAKRLAQVNASATSESLLRHGMMEIPSSRGESAFVWDEGEAYKAFVVEGLGTKNLVADSVREFSGRTHYDALAKDTVAMIVNDLIVVGADPMVVNAYYAVGSSDWFSDQERAADLVNGFRDAVMESGATWGGGETPTLKGVIEPTAIDLSGAAIGIIKPKERLTLGDKLEAGDVIFAVESSGIHANGLTLARKISDSAPQGYETRLSDGTTYGETLLTPTHIYAGLVRDLFDSGVDIHYMVNVTGHGWRKLMRANRDFSYVIDQIPTPQPIFQFIQEQSGNSDEEMYGNFNMGVGFAIFMPEDSIQEASRIALENYGLQAGQIGTVNEGPKSVAIRPKNLVFDGSTLAVR